MSTSSPAPGGLSPKEFKLAATEVGQWLWGTVQGAFNEKQTLSQIITDAVIGMIPLVGDVTAARDLIAVGSGLASDHKKREETVEWVLLVILIFALIPVFGGVIKGVGRIALKVTGATAADARLIARVADDIIQFLNRIGHKNAQAWFKSLDVMVYQAQILSKFRAFCDVVIISIYRYGLRFRAVLPQSLVARMEQLSNGFQQLKALGDQMIPQALKELHGKLQELQRFVHAGGKPGPSRAAVMQAQTGQKVVSYAEEARLLEGKMAKRVRHAGKYPQNFAGVDDLSKIRKVYQHKPGYPDLLKRTGQKDLYHAPIAAASGKISNEMLSGVTLHRSFGPAGTTLGVNVGQSYPIGAFWAIGTPASTATKWRDPCAVLDEWNRNGWLSILHIPSHVKIPACTSVVSEQFSKDIAGQFLEGGARQAVIEMDRTTADLAVKLAAAGGGKIVLPNGAILEIRRSGWTNTNGAIGYGDIVIPAAGVVERLGVSERQVKVVKQVAQAAPKNERAK